MSDLISREALLDEIHNHYEVCNHSQNALMDKVSMLIIKAAAVDCVPVLHGEWIMRGGKRYCSACGERACVTRDSDDFWYTVGTRFCPNCGAKMDGGKPA